MQKRVILHRDIRVANFSHRHLYIMMLQVGKLIIDHKKRRNIALTNQKIDLAQAFMDNYVQAKNDLLPKLTGYISDDETALFRLLKIRSIKRMRRKEEVIEVEQRMTIEEWMKEMLSETKRHNELLSEIANLISDFMVESDSDEEEEEGVETNE